MKEESLLYKIAIENNPHIDNRVIPFFFSAEEKYIVGNGRQAAVCLEFCRSFGTKVAGVVIMEPFWDYSERKGIWKRLLEEVNPIKLGNLKERGLDVALLLTVGATNYESCEDILQREGFSNIYRCWWRSNQDMRDVCYTVDQSIRDKAFFRGMVK